MARFKVGDRANLANGSEIEVQVNGVSTEMDLYHVESMNGEHRVYGVKPSALLPLKGPYFDIRGLVFTTSVNHPGEQGEIVMLGKGPKERRFYSVRFMDGSTQWLSEDEVFIETPAKRVPV